MSLPRIQTFKNVIARYIESGEGRRTMAAKMTPSLRRFRDYSAVGRKAFLVEDLEDGALPIYDKDPIVLRFRRSVVSGPKASLTMPFK